MVHEMTDHKFQNNLRAMLNWFLSPKSGYLDIEGQHAVEMVARSISSGYANLP